MYNPYQQQQYNPYLQQLQQMQAQQQGAVNNSLVSVRSEAEAQEKGFCFLKKASWFTREQVELIEA